LPAPPPARHQPGDDPAMNQRHEPASWSSSCLVEYPTRPCSGGSPHHTNPRGPDNRQEVVRSIYEIDDPTVASEFVDRLALDLQDREMPPEVRSLGRTLKRRQSQKAYRSDWWPPSARHSRPPAPGGREHSRRAPLLDGHPAPSFRRHVASSYRARTSRPNPIGGSMAPGRVLRCLDRRWRAVAAWTLGSGTYRRRGRRSCRRSDVS